MYICYVKRLTWCRPETKNREWIDYYGSEQIIIAFLTSKDGLNSTFDQSQFQDIYNILRPEFKIHLAK